MSSIIISFAGRIEVTDQGLTGITQSGRRRKIEMSTSGCAVHLRDAFSLGC